MHLIVWIGIAASIAYLGLAIFVRKPKSRQWREIGTIPVASGLAIWCFIGTERALGAMFIIAAVSSGLALRNELRPTPEREIAPGVKVRREGWFDWVASALIVAAFFLAIDLHEAIGRYFLIGFAVASIAFFALREYGRRVALPRLKTRRRSTPAKDLISRGPFCGWSMGVLRATGRALGVFVLAGSLSGLFISTGYPIVGGLFAAIALCASPWILASGLAAFILLVGKLQSVSPR